ncbi:hypothetical protein J32TS6_18850 [Virgibacillus pantothenticus]|uniref:hypothetical protein n=1 Tax=Virgibacillus pantothenticus TaxID=1473 RepID=UPI001B219331|nr:hypothetical protein [Virgibacillus pantothenticus]GIP63330.1 hypothetical protein J32TS6_18850 [Virgibacillus pantothenticus]
MANDGKKIRLKQIYDEIDKLNPDHLSDLNKMIRLYSQAQMIIGYLDADASYKYGAVYAERKRLQGEIKQSYKGTGVEKEAQADIETYDLRMKEAQVKAESRKWQNLFKSTDNLIIALRRDERTALEEYKKVNDLYER